MSEYPFHQPGSDRLRIHKTGLLAPLLAGQDVGIISEAGCTGIADPGADLVNLAHRKGIRVVRLVGPSSILLALMASGLNGQCFAFHGYLPIEDAEKKAAIMALEAESIRRKQTQIFIETPTATKECLAPCSGTAGRKHNSAWPRISLYLANRSRHARSRSGNRTRRRK